MENAEVILDVGANLGNHTLYWNKNVKGLKEIHSFEPLNVNFSLLKRNVEENNLDKTVLVNKCVGIEKAKAVVEKVNRNNMGGTVFTYDKDISSKGSELAIDVIDLDSYVKEQGITQVDFIKIDTEGFELDVLKGAKTLLGTHKPVVWFEAWDKNWVAVYKQMAEFGYYIKETINDDYLYVPIESIDIESMKDLTKEELEAKLIIEKTLLKSYEKSYKFNNVQLNDYQRKFDKLRATPHNHTKNNTFPSRIKSCQKSVDVPYFLVLRHTSLNCYPRRTVS